MLHGETIARVRPPRFEHAVADNIGVTLTGKGCPGSFACLHEHPLWVEKDLGDDAAVNVHFLESLAVQFDVDHDG